MSRLLGIVYVLILLVLLVTMTGAAVGKVASENKRSEAALLDSRASWESARGQSEASIIRAKGEQAIDHSVAQQINQQSNDQSRLTTVTVVSGFVTSVTPFIALLGIVVALFLILAFIAVLFYLYYSRQQPVQIIRQVEILPPPGATRREVWQLATEHKERIEAQSEIR